MCPILHVSRRPPTSGQLVQLQQVKDGWVWANGKYKSDCPQWNEIAAAEREARSQRRGIWTGNPQPPWEWRKAHR
ncbi:MAG: thermonuclease family protein [Microcystaceae cyanobacterium]